MRPWHVRNVRKPSVASSRMGSPMTPIAWMLEGPELASTSATIAPMLCPTTCVGCSSVTTVVRRSTTASSVYGRQFTGSCCAISEEVWRNGLAVRELALQRIPNAPARQEAMEEHEV
jgi:hypothetical protein